MRLSQPGTGTGSGGGAPSSICFCATGNRIKGWALLQEYGPPVLSGLAGWGVGSWVVANAAYTPALLQWALPRGLSPPGALQGWLASKAFTDRINRLITEARVEIERQQAKFRGSGSHSASNPHRAHLGSFLRAQFDRRRLAERRAPGRYLC